MKARSGSWCARSGFPGRTLKPCSCPRRPRRTPMATPNDNQWCFAWPAARKSVSGKDKAALVKASRWNSGDIITVSFLDGDPDVQDKVAEAARGWTAPQLANLTLDFRKNTNDTLVRISFQNPG